MGVCGKFYIEKKGQCSFSPLNECVKYYMHHISQTAMLDLENVLQNKMFSVPIGSNCDPLVVLSTF